MLVVQSRVIIAAVFLVTVLALFNRRLLIVSPRHILDFALLGIIGVAGSNYTYYMAIQITNVGIAILMQYTAPTLVAIYMVLSRQERVSGVKSLAIVLSLSGSAVMLGAFSPNVHITMLGIFLGMLSALCFAFFNVYNRVASKEYSTWTALTWTLVCGAAFWIILDAVTGPVKGDIGIQEMWTLTIFSFSSIVIPYYFYFTGLRHLAASTAVIVSTLEPVVAILTSFIILGESMSLTQTLGGIFVVGAVILLEVFKE